VKYFFLDCVNACGVSKPIRVAREPAAESVLAVGARTAMRPCIQLMSSGGKGEVEGISISIVAHRT
jgi:hypothetical protein